MANTSLPTGLTTGTTTHIADHNTIHAEVNELSRDTGLRSLTSLLANGWTATGVRIERVRDLVHFYWRGLDGSAATSAAFLTFGPGAGDIPIEFSSMDGSYQSAVHADNTGGTYRIRAISPNIQVASSGGTALRDLGGYWRMTTWHAASSAWPSRTVGSTVAL